MDKEALNMFFPFVKLLLILTVSLQKKIKDEKL